MSKRRAPGEGKAVGSRSARAEREEDFLQLYNQIRRARQDPAGESEEGRETPSIYSDEGLSSEDEEDSQLGEEDDVLSGDEAGSSGEEEGDSDQEDDDDEDEEDEEEEQEEDEEEVGRGGGTRSRGAVRGGGEDVAGVSGGSSDDELDQAMLDLVAGNGPRRRRRRARAEAPRAVEVPEQDAFPQVWDSAGEGSGQEEEEEDGEDKEEDDGDDASEQEEEEEEDEEDGEKKKEREKGRQARLWKALEADPGSESSEDERPARNTVGSVPLVWYKDEDHIGYDVEGKKLIKKGRRRDKLDSLLARNDSAKDWRTIYDDYNDEEITLSKEELQLIQRIRQGRFPDVEINPYEPEVDFFTREPMKHPLNNAPEPKRRFMPSKWEEKKVVKLVRALRRGWLKVKEEEEEEQEPPVYLLWADDGRVADKTASGLTYIPPPKPPLPGHEESYHPPPEFLPTPEEREEAANKEPDEEGPSFLPMSFPSLRAVPQYADFIKERFERCLDLYLCPRARRKRPLVKDPKSLIPQLPKPSDLQPYPSTLLIRYVGHTGTVRCIQADPSGQWLASGSDDGTLRVWEVATGRCMRTWHLGHRVFALAWCPNQALHLLAACFGNVTRLLCPGLGSEEVEAATGQALEAAAKAAGLVGGGESPLCRWTRLPQHAALDLVHNHPVTWVTWHGRGDYFATVAPTGNTQAVLVHQLSRGATQNPFRKNRGRLVRVAFHPAKPFFFVATQNAVRVYNLAQQALTKKLVAGSGSITSLAVHPSGDHVITGSEDKRLAWYDMDLSTKPYKVLRYHAHALSGVAFHRSYPLFASASDDATVHVFHGMVYQDLMTNPLVVPLKVLRGHGAASIRDVAFHPTQPWLFSAGEDASICLFTN